MEKYKNANLPVEERIDDLLSKMTLEEKILQTDQYFSNDFTIRTMNDVVTFVDMDKVHDALQGNSVGSIQTRGMTAGQNNLLQKYAIEKTRLGIPFLFSEEGLHGVFAAKATSFPQQIGLAATFNPTLGNKMGRAIATEARACGIHETYSPVMDLMRDPRFGRTEESYGEDVHLCSEFAREVVLGMQGDGIDKQDAIAAEPKHFVGYGNPIGGLNCAPSNMGRHDVFAECLPVFEAAYIDGKATNAMCSYNAIDGIPVAMDKEILTDILRNEYGMPGFVRTDMTAVVRLNDWHFITQTRKEAIQKGLEAGVDLQLYDFPHEEWKQGISQLIEEGKLSEKVLEECCRRVLRVKFLLGLFENPYTDESLEEKVVHCQAHTELAEQIARESICLLENKDNLLPLSKKLAKIAVLGPSANEAYLGDYSEARGRVGQVTILDGVNAMVSDETQVQYHKGCNFLGDKLTPFTPGLLTNEQGNPGLTARYYNGPNPEGEPVVISNDLMINFNWIFSKPHPELDNRCYSVKWTGYVKMSKRVDGCIGLSSQDSMRLYIDDVLLVDGWGADKEASQIKDFVFEAERQYKVEIDFTNDERAARIVFGYNTGREDFAEAISIAKQADVVVLCLGDNEETSGENYDRTNLDLPGNQLKFAKKVYDTGTPVVLVLQSGRPASINWEREHIPAILQAWPSGERGGAAIAQTIFGENVPSGHLPMSFPKSVGQIPCHYSRKPGGGRRYIEMTWDPLYPFGYGLSYTQFAYQDFTLGKEQLVAGEEPKVKMSITNIGEYSGVAVPQLYIRDCFASVVKPIKELAAFEKVEIEAGETKTVELTVNLRRMRTLNPEYKWEIEPGEFEIMVGENAQDILWKGRVAVKE